MNNIAGIFGSEGMSNKVTVYIPATVNVNKTLNADTATKYVNLALTKLSQLYGGATALSATGGWVSQSDGLVTEAVTLVYSFTGELDRGSLLEVKAFCEFLKTELKQEAIAVEINGKLLFI